LDFVKTLYLAGAIEVSVDPDSRNREWVPARGDYVISDRMGANALLVRVPAEPGTPQGVLRLLQMEQDQHGAWVQRMYETGSSVPVVDDEIVRVSWRPQSFI
jgi:hypothetical protein